MKKIITTVWVATITTIWKRAKRNIKQKKAAMNIQFNTDKTVNGNEKQELHFTSLIAETLNRFQSHITRIEVHVSDENGSKKGVDDIRCLLEARMEGRQPISVSAQAGTIEAAVASALDKLKASLETIIGRIQNR
jgi:hypothetical protein